MSETVKHPAIFSPLAIVKFDKAKSAFLFFVLAAAPLFSAVPIQGENLSGAGAINARFSLISSAEAYLGTPYRYSGFDRQGMDCSGLVYTSFRDSLKVNVPRTAADLYFWAEKIPVSQIRPGDLVFFITGGGSEVTHVGIFIGNGRFIHSASEGPKTGVMYSTLDEAYWKRTYAGAGRVLPWDSESEIVFAQGSYGRQNGTPKEPSYTAGQIEPEKNELSAPAAAWVSSSGFFAGAGLAWTFGGFFPGAPELFRGLAGQVKAGYKGLFVDSFQIALEARPEWDRSLGIVRLPFTLSLGTDIFQVFAGPALTIGKPVLASGEEYHPGFSFLGELGFSAAFPPIKLRGGALSVFVEMAWQPYSMDSAYNEKLISDAAANTRLSAGLRYLHLLES